jgi:hypothetical protein
MWMKMKNGLSLSSLPLFTRTHPSFFPLAHPPTHPLPLSLSLSLSLSFYLFNPSAPDAALQATPPAARREAVPPGR